MIAGLDISTRAIHIVSLPEDTNDAQLHVVRIDTRRGDHIDRIRRLRDTMPARTAWREHGCALIAIEKPFFRGPGIAPMMAVYGAILQLFPADLPLLELRSDDWRKECGIPIRKPRDGGSDFHKRCAVAFAREQWTGAPPPESKRTCGGRPTSTSARRSSPSGGSTASPTPPLSAPGPPTRRRDCGRNPSGLRTSDAATTPGTQRFRPRDQPRKDTHMSEDVTPRELMDDAARIGGWIRELRSLQTEEELLGERIYKELGPLADGDDNVYRTITVRERIRAERPEIVERINFLGREVEACLARGRLVEMAALAERLV